MAQKPNRVQTAIEVAYDLTKNNITGGNLDTATAARWFPFLAALFFWIWFSNMIGFLPLPTNTEHTVDVFGLEIPMPSRSTRRRRTSDPARPHLGRPDLLPRRRFRAKGFFSTWRAGCRRAWRI